jgi:hypothetical protein
MRAIRNCHAPGEDMRIYKRAALLFLLLFIPVECRLQSPEKLKRFDSTEAMDELNRAFRSYDTAFENLRATRGLSPQTDITRRFIFLGAAPLSGSTNGTNMDLVEVLRKQYSPETGLVFYSHDQKNVFRVWLITGQGIKAYHKDVVPIETLGTSISNLRVALGVEALQSARYFYQRGFEFGGDEPAKAAPVSPRQAIADLTAILLPDVVADELASVKHLIVNPILGIGSVPFAVLQPFKSNDYLIDRVSISFAPSIYDLSGSGDKWQPRFQHPLIVGNPYLPSDGKWIVPSLPGAELEARTIGKIIGGAPILGKEATKEKVLLAAGEADFLFFATHGVASNEDPLTKSFLALSAPTLEDGFWTAKEVQASKLKARIAVLSACQTGLGQTHDAGTIGLARAFQIAGVPRVVMSLWRVNDLATSDLMRSFVGQLQTHSPSEALRQAMLETRKTRPRPSEWASFVLFGSSE